MTYYLKYRPQKLSELDMESVRESLTKIARNKNIPHAFLFSGPKGTGKTSAARILAKVINCESGSKSLRGTDLVEPCNKCKQCISITKGDNIDVIEIDAASHRGIDDIRNLREAVKLSTAIAQKKIYIIDEAHMLTTEASNALLKTLEEPPEHAVFILATTNPEKLIDTIRSRVVNIKFSKATNDEIENSLKKVIKGENLKIEDASVKFIAKSSDGSFRDATKILEQLVSEHKNLSIKNVEKFLVGSGSEGVEKLIAQLIEKDTKGALESVDLIHENGGHMKDLLFSLMECMRKSLLEKVGLVNEDSKENKFKILTKKQLIKLIELFSDANDKMSNAIIEQIPVELAVIDWCESGEKPDNTKPVIKNESSSNEHQEKMTIEDSSKSINNISSTNKKSKVTKRANNLNEITAGVWSEVLNIIRPKNTSTEALLRAAKPVNFDGKKLTLGVYYSFHKERLESHQHRELLESALADVLNSSVRIECVLTEQEKKIPEKVQEEVVLTEDKDEDIVKIAEEIFGT
jgi:DNA polymerase-3 subunit gamma/tau